MFSDWERWRVFWFDDMKNCFLSKACLVHLFFDESHRKFRTIDRWKIKRWQNISKTSDMIEMPVRDEYSSDIFFEWEQKRNVWETEFRSEFRIFWNMKTSIYEKEFILVLENTHILSHLIMTSDDDESSVSWRERWKFLWWKRGKNRWKNIFISKITRFFSWSSRCRNWWRRWNWRDDWSWSFRRIFGYRLRFRHISTRQISEKWHRIKIIVRRKQTKNEINFQFGKKEMFQRIISFLQEKSRRELSKFVQKRWYSWF